MARLKESYDAREVSALLADMDPAGPEDVSIATDGRRLDSADDVTAFVDEIRAERDASSSSSR